jgi:transcriptional regulator with XRE-family HTH domain
MTACRERRKAKGWNQEQLAVYSGVGVSTVRRLEDGGEVRLSSLRKLAKALGCSEWDIAPKAPRAS